MCLAFLFEELEAGAEECGHTATIVATHAEAAASLGTVGRKSSNHDVTAGPHRARRQPGVAFLIGGFDEEVEDGAVVPEIDHR
jgi:hypothetical protein